MNFGENPFQKSDLYPILGKEHPNLSAYDICYTTLRHLFDRGVIERRSTPKNHFSYRFATEILKDLYVLATP